MRVNGQLAETGPSEERLLDFLRERLGLTGAKEGCGMGECGACTVLMEGEAVCSCLVLVGQVGDASIVTVEGLGAPELLHPFQQAVVDAHATQCGFCTPGVVVSVAGLLMKDPHPEPDAVLQAIEGNLCRCTGYAPIFQAVEAAGAAPRL
ncbi:MAG: (2Fe-2S)-binding protein [Actinomycetota bacterium]